MTDRAEVAEPEDHARNLRVVRNAVIEYIRTLEAELRNDPDRVTRLDAIVNQLRERIDYPKWAKR